MSPKPRSGRPTRFLVVSTVVVVAVAGFGFLFKLFELIAAYLSGDTSFALGPVSVYLAVAAGFLCLFVWATLRGQFHDVEGPKYRMLEREDALEHGKWPAPERSEHERRLEEGLKRLARDEGSDA